MKRIFIFGLIFAFTLSAASLFGQFDERKGHLSLILGGYSNANTKLEVDLSKSKRYQNAELYPKQTYDVELPDFLIGFNVREYFSGEERPFYIGGGVLLNYKSKQNFIIFNDLGALPTRVKSYFIDFNLGTEIPFLSVGRKFVPFVEGGPGIHGVYKSVYVLVPSPYTLSLSYKRMNAGSENSLVGHVGVGARSYLGEEQNFFVGGKLTFYGGAEKPKVFLFEVGGRF